MVTVAEALAAGLSDYHAGRLHEAEQTYRQIIAIEPSNADAWQLLGTIAHDQGNLDKAVQFFRRVLELRPEFVDAHYNLGICLYEQGKLEEAKDCFHAALRLKPEYAVAHYSLGFAYDEQAKWPEAMACYRRAIELKAEYADAHWNLSLILLRFGDFEHGCVEHEWRWKIDQTQPREFAEPRWNGEALERKTILLHAEQGFGDTIQFVRYAAVVKERNPDATVIVECQKRLVNLLRSCRGIDRLVAAGEELPGFDVQAPLLSLPGILKTTLETIPADVPYLFADPGLVAEWGKKLGAVVRAHPMEHRNRCQPPAQFGQGLTDLFCVGINWHGREGNVESRRRDVPVEFFERVAAVPGVRLVSLQKGDPGSEVQGPTSMVEGERSESSEAGTARPTIVDVGEFDTERGAFVDTAAIMMNLDLVITSDTSVAHLAGALGVSVCVALPFVPDWRWLLDRSDSPWYPTMRLFRQKRIGDWAGVFGEIEAALRERVQGSKFKVQG